MPILIAPMVFASKLSLRMQVWFGNPIGALRAAGTACGVTIWLIYTAVSSPHLDFWRVLIVVMGWLLFTWLGVKHRLLSSVLLRRPILLRDLSNSWAGGFIGGSCTALILTGYFAKSDHDVILYGMAWCIGFSFCTAKIGCAKAGCCNWVQSVAVAELLKRWNIRLPLIEVFCCSLVLAFSLILHVVFGRTLAASSILVGLIAIRFVSAALRGQFSASRHRGCAMPPYPSS